MLLPSDLRQKLRVNLVNAQGLDEPGIDGGGVFREFLSDLLKTGFDPNHGYFATTQDGLLYPNPQVSLQLLLDTVIHVHRALLLPPPPPPPPPPHTHTNRRHTC